MLKFLDNDIRNLYILVFICLLSVFWIDQMRCNQLFNQDNEIKAYIHHEVEARIDLLSFIEEQNARILQGY